MDSLVKLGQRFVVGFPGLFPDEKTLSIIKEMKIGNIILFKSNVESKEQLEKLTAFLDKFIYDNTSFHPFIMIDQEGGMVSRLSNDYAIIPGAMALASNDNTDDIEECGYITATELRNSGVNFNIAPVVDINTAREKSILGVRSYGESTDDVIKYSTAMLHGLKRGGVFSCCKHFPGHGDVAVDSHIGLPVCYKTEEEIFQTELKPYINAISLSCPAIMTTHILFPKIDPSNYPATMSEKIIRGILRNKLNFDGLVVTDCLEMGAIKDHYTTEEGARKALLSGIDIACISHTIETALASMKRVMEDENWQENQDESFNRIKRIKDEYFSKLNSYTDSIDIEQSKKEINRIGEKTITKYRVKTPLSFGSDTIFIAPHPFVVTAIMNPEDKDVSFASTMAKAFSSSGLDIPVDPDKEEIAKIVEKAKNYKKIVVGTYNALSKRGQIDLVKEIAKLNRDLTVVALRNPYDLEEVPEKANAIAIYEYSVQSMEWFIKSIKENLPSSARVPFSLRK